MTVFPDARGFRRLRRPGSSRHWADALDGSGSAREWLRLPGWFRGELYRIAALAMKAPCGRHINAACRQRAPLVAGATKGALWVLGNGDNLSLWQPRIENHTAGLRPEENKPTALTGDGNAPLLPPAAASLHGKASHVIFRSLSLPYKSRSLATPEGEICSPLSFWTHKYLKA